ncbi:MAG: DMT family transporter [Rhodocyclaceae bacterium]|nr:DMT family transporter [Rhodocyclaceae bacterium]MBX3669073.1 DMT family transporter [Rhodocyclaceae bacterium]
MQRFLPWLFVLLWSTGFIGAKFGLPYADPLAFLFVRYCAVVVLVLPLALITRAPWPADLRGALHIGMAGLLVQATYLGGVFSSIALGLPSGVTSLVVGLQPLITAALAGLALGEQVSSRQWTGLVAALAGVALVLGGRSDVAAGARIDFAQVIPALIALAGISLGTLYQKRFCPQFDLRTGAFLQFLPSAIVTGIIVFAGGRWRIDWQPAFVFAACWLTFVLSFGAMSLLHVLIRRGTAVAVASLFYLTPVVTAVLAFILFGERLTPLQLAGMALAVAGVSAARGKSR